MSFNAIARKIHLWLGISCGLLASISGITGGMYVWQPELSALLNPKLLKVKNVNALNDAVFIKTASFLAEIHTDSIAKIMLPYREQQTISIEFKNGNTKYYDPGNGEFLGNKSASILFFENLLAFHRTLLIPKIGKYITGTSTIVFCLMVLISGIYIWFKNYGSNIKEGVRLKWKSKKRKFNFDLHKVLGFGFFIPLFVIAFTGSYFTYNSFYKKALTVFDQKAGNKQIQQIGNTMFFDSVLLHSDKSYALRAIYYPKETSGSYRFRYVENRNITAGLRKTKELMVSSDHKITSLEDYRYSLLSNRIALQFYPVHVGEIAGVFGRILVFVSGLVPLTLYITGFRIYRSKKRKKRK